jgi:hypothetical protein
MTDSLGFRDQRNHAAGREMEGVPPAQFTVLGAWVSGIEDV